MWATMQHFMWSKKFVRAARSSMYMVSIWTRKIASKEYRTSSCSNKLNSCSLIRKMYPFSKQFWWWGVCKFLYQWTCVLDWWSLISQRPKKMCRQLWTMPKLSTTNSVCCLDKHHAKWWVDFGQWEKGWGDTPNAIPTNQAWGHSWCIHICPLWEPLPKEQNHCPNKHVNRKVCPNVEWNCHRHWNWDISCNILWHYVSSSVDHNSSNHKNVAKLYAVWWQGREAFHTNNSHGSEQHPIRCLVLSFRISNIKWSPKQPECQRCYNAAHHSPNQLADEHRAWWWQS